MAMEAEATALREIAMAAQREFERQWDGWSANMTRQQHLDWCKTRALAYLGRGELANAVASMGSDLGKHPDTAALCNPYLIVAGTISAANGDTDAVRRWINGFN